MANPTVLEKPGAFLLAPIYRLLFGFYLDLTEDQVKISYKTYKAENQADMMEIIDQQLAPGKINQKKFSTFCLVASVAQGHQGNQTVSLAMVLDTYDKDQDLLIFNNTYDDPSGGQPKKFKIKRTHQNAPEELYFVHIEIRDMNSLPSQEQREADKEAEMKQKENQYLRRTLFDYLCCCFAR